MHKLDTIAFQDSGWNFSYLMHRMADTKKTVVLMPSAQVLEKRRNPYFSRWKWHDAFGCNVIAVSDPTLQLHPSMIGGWFQGTHTNHVLPKVLAHLKGFLLDLGAGWADCTFLGSSLGGFASLQAICLEPEASAYVEIAQIDLRKYVDPSMKELARFCYGESDLEAVPTMYDTRLNVISLLEETQQIGSLHYVQQLRDGHHLREHYTPFADAMTRNGAKYCTGFARMELIRTEGSGLAHRVLEKGEAVHRVRALVTE